MLPIQKPLHSPDLKLFIVDFATGASKPILAGLGSVKIRFDGGLFQFEMQ